MSLDWDHYEATGQLLRSCHQDTEPHEPTLMMSNGSDMTLLQASRASPPSPYVLCYECSDDFSLNEDQKFTRSRPEPRNSSPLERDREPLDLSVNHR